MIRVLVADDQEMVRMGFAMILDAAPDIDVVAQAADGVQAIEAVRAANPDVALLDIRMPRVDGLEVCKRISLTTRVVMVTTLNDDDYVDTALANGATGFLLKDSGPDLLFAAVRAAVAGDALLSPELTTALLRRTRARTERPVPPEFANALATLSPRELDVARLVAEGATNAEIGERLFLSLGTVKTHIASIQRRLTARNRVEIAARAWQSGLMD
ncbi:response regulator [Nocardia crassostreae]|uniref:response regulator n=1 Tax=Nocardia crassostreae TaxID=53428 RepID=UPI0008332D17|nr:response regulator transcription factor [Nocardia crassostreae]